MSLEKKDVLRFTDAQLKQEMDRCEYCEEKPCKDACPVDCSPFDFIMAAREMRPADFQRSAAIIMKNNPLGGVCGAICPDTHCMSECSHKLFDGAINIPDIQAEIVDRAKKLGGIPLFDKLVSNGKKVAVIGGGPAGLAAGSVLVQKGYKVDVYESRSELGGMCNLIPEHRLPVEILRTDIEFIKLLGDITFITEHPINDISELSDRYDGIIVSSGLWDPYKLGIAGEEETVNAIDFLSDPASFDVKGKNVAIIGGGATALDCAVTAKQNQAARTELIALESFSELPMTQKERDEIMEYSIELSCRTKVLEILTEDKKIIGLKTRRIKLREGEPFSLSAISDIEGSDTLRKDIDYCIIAIGNRAKNPAGLTENIIVAGDCINGPTTVVEAAAAGKNAAIGLDSVLLKTPSVEIKKKTKSYISLDGYVHEPVSLETDFFGKRIATPFLLSAAPPSDGYEQMKLAYESGWSGGIMKTAFDNVPIHIPGEYMHVFGDKTYGNCDNVSGHSLSRVCSEVDKLVKEFPDRLTMASTGGPVTGNEEDSLVWKSNTEKLESAGVMGIEYSLSCPQGGDGTEGDIVSQNAELTASIVNWILDGSSPDIPKLFKLTAAVTSIVPIINAIKGVLDKFPEHKAGVTLANTFPVMDFRESKDEKWEKGILFGMSGEGVAPISYFTLSRAVPLGVVISGNGGPMNYVQAAHFLALGVETVQFCTVATKYGYGIINELKNGVSYLMKSRGIGSMDELIGIAQPDPVIDFMELTPEKKISSLISQDLCVSCGNCGRCPYLAISLDEEGYPVIDPERCIGCSICTKKCFVQALEMRVRTKEEKDKLKED